MKRSTFEWWRKWASIRCHVLARQRQDAIHARFTDSRRRMYERWLARLEELADAKEAQEGGLPDQVCVPPIL